MPIPGRRTAAPPPGAAWVGPLQRPVNPPPADVQHQRWIKRQPIRNGIIAGEQLEAPGGGSDDLSIQIPTNVSIRGPWGGEFLQSSISANQPSGFRLFSGNSNRRYLMIQNNSDADVYVGLGMVPDANTGVRLAAGGGSWELPAMAVPTNDIWFYGTGTGRVVGIEG